MTTDAASSTCRGEKDYCIAKKSDVVGEGVVFLGGKLGFRRIELDPRKS